MTTHVRAPLVQPALVAENCREPIKSEGRASVLIERGVTSTSVGAVGKKHSIFSEMLHQWLARKSKTSCKVCLLWLSCEAREFQPESSRLY